MICPRCGKSLRNLPEHLPDAVPVACNECLRIADKPEAARTVADEANMTIDQVRRGGARRRG